MKLTLTSIDGLYIAQTQAIKDDRGAFARLFCADDLRAAIGTRSITQINQSTTAQLGAVRGMHYQNPPHAEMKMVRCIKGRVLDVAIDLRRGSKTFLQYVAQELSPDNALMMVIPEGFAHGFQVLEPDSQMLYLHTAAYHPESEGAVRYDDPMINVQWPLEVVDLSPRDRAHPLLPKNFKGIIL